MYTLRETESVAKFFLEKLYNLTYFLCLLHSEWTAEEHRQEEAGAGGCYSNPGKKGGVLAEGSGRAGGGSGWVLGLSMQCVKR